MVESEDLTVKYRNQIRPILEMLKSKKPQLTELDWEDLVSRTRESILNSPEQYLSDLLQKEALNPIISKLFDEFVSEVR